jgi:predicted Zn-dependent protease
MRIRSRAVRLGVVVLVAGLSACAVNPVTGKRSLSLMSESQEIQLGTESDPQIVAEYGLYDDPKVAAYVDEIGQKMAKLSHRPDLKWTFRVLDSPVMNAFALPGGYCYITRGILAHMNTEAELAVVMGHEIGHVTARHGADQYTRQQIAGIGLGVGSLLSQTIAAYGGAAQEALGMMFLKYGRDDESQSDELGVEYSMKAGYDADQGVRFFEVLDRQQKESGEEALPEWMSTHPAPEGRVTRTRELAAKRKPEFPQATRVGEADHKAIIDGIVFGDNPRQGFMDGNTFKHPGAQFQLDLPAGWPVQNTPSALLAGAPDQKALIQMTLENSGGASAADYAAQLAEKAKAQIADGGPEKIAGLDAFVGVFVVSDQQGNQSPVQAGFIPYQDKGMFQIVGMAQPDQFKARRPEFLSTIRSWRPLTDPADLNREPDRVHIQTLPRDATVQEVAEKIGPTSAVPLKTVAFINNLQGATSLPKGFQLKLVKSGKAAATTQTKPAPSTSTSGKMQPAPPATKATDKPATKSSVPGKPTAPAPSTTKPTAPTKPTPPKPKP